MVDSLNPYTEYVCIIAAHTVAGLGPYTVELLVRTQEDSKCSC